MHRLSSYHHFRISCSSSFTLIILIRPIISSPIPVISFDKYKQPVPSSSFLTWDGLFVWFLMLSSSSYAARSNLSCRCFIILSQCQIPCYILLLVTTHRSTKSSEANTATYAPPPSQSIQSLPIYTLPKSSLTKNLLGSVQKS